MYFIVCIWLSVMNDDIEKEMYGKSIFFVQIELFYITNDNGNIAERRKKKPSWKKIFLEFDLDVTFDIKNVKQHFQAIDWIKKVCFQIEVSDRCAIAANANTTISLEM